MSRRRLLHLGFLMLASVSWTARLEAGESYYVLIFGSQSHPKLLRRAHSWATFVRVDDANLYVHTISWLPQTLKVRTFAPCPEPGVNLELHQTLNIVLSDGEGVTMWGPHPISGDAYMRSLHVKSTIESGATDYRAISPAHDIRLFNCNQAVLSVGPEFGQRFLPLRRTGTAAGWYISREVMSHSCLALTDNSWLIPRLGLDRYPINFIPLGGQPTGIPPVLSY